MEDTRAVNGKRFCEICEELVDAEPWENYRDHIQEHVDEFAERTGTEIPSPGAYVWADVVAELNSEYVWVTCNGEGCDYAPETLQRPDTDEEYCLGCRRKREEAKEKKRPERTLETWT